MCILGFSYVLSVALSLRATIQYFQAHTPQFAPLHAPKDFLVKLFFTKYAQRFAITRRYLDFKAKVVYKCSTDVSKYVNHNNVMLNIIKTKQDMFNF